ncbi:MAG TPA: pitrilysin family protein [Trichocoleus sp.]|jgi:zinc protease
MQRLLHMKNLGRRWLRYGLMSIVVLGIVILGFGRQPALAVTPQHYTDLQLPSPPEIKLPDYTRFELPNGLKVYLLEDHELPLIGGTAIVYTGDRLEPADKVGLAGITGAVMRSGGTTAHSADALNRRLEQQAASIETGIDTTAGSASFNTLTEDLEEVFGLFAEVLRQPAFPQDKIDLVKAQIGGSIARRNDNPNEIAQREFFKLVYGANSPYARTVEYSTLSNISRSDVVSFYQQYFHPNNMLLGIVGDFDQAKMRSLIEAKLGDWQPSSTSVKETISLPQVSQAKTSGVFLVDQPQLTQSTILMGHLGGEIRDPGYAPLTVLDEVMGGFGGRLMNEVRSRQGLAYGVYATWSPQFDFPGVYIGGGQTRTETTVPFIQSTLAEIKKVQTTPVTEAELSRAKDSVLNTFVFRFATPAQTLSRVMRYDYYGYPQDFIFRYQKQVETTTAAEVQQAAQTYLKPENIVTLVVGNAKAMNPPLSTLTPNTPVTSIDITIPQPKA